MKSKNIFQYHDLFKSYIFFLIIQLLFSSNESELCNNCQYVNNKCENNILEINCDCSSFRPHYENEECYKCENINENDFYSIDNEVCKVKNNEGCPYKIIFGTNECVGQCPNNYYELGDYCYLEISFEDLDMEKDDQKPYKSCKCRKYYNKTTINPGGKEKYDCKENCGNFFYDLETGECVENCGNKKFYEEEDEPKRCSFKCKTNEFMKENYCYKRGCPNNNDYIYTNILDGTKECLSKCKDKDINLIESENRCVTHCSEGVIVFDKKNEGEEEEFIKKCLTYNEEIYYEFKNIFFTDCQFTKNLFDKITYSYTINQESGGPKKICVEDCKAIEQFLDGDKCVEKCIGDNQFYFDKKCLSNCSTTDGKHDYKMNFKFNYNNIINVIVDDEVEIIIINALDYPDSFECLKECPKGTYIDNLDRDNKTCYVSSCNRDNYINTTNLECINSCNKNEGFIYNEIIYLQYIPRPISSTGGGGGDGASGGRVLEGLGEGQNEGIIYNITRQFCLSSCPKTSPYYDFGDNICFKEKCKERQRFSAYDNPYICYESCDNITNYKNEKDYICYKEEIGCDKDYYYYEGKTKMCVNEQDCIGKFRYIQEKECVNNCKENYYKIEPESPDNNGIFTKLGACFSDPKDCINKNYPYFNNTMKICSKKCDLYKTDPVTQNQNNETCFDSCSGEFPYADDDEKKCLKICDEQKYYDGNKCVGNCTDSNKYHFENSKECVSNCSDYYLKEGENICYYSCPSDTFVVEYFDQQNLKYKKICNETCNENSPYYYDDLKICRNECELYDNNHSKCVYQCKPGEVVYEQNCTDECPKEMFISKENLSESNAMIVEKCVDKCPPLKLISNKTHYCLEKCLFDEKYEYNNTCYEKCPNDTYLDEINEKCYNYSCPLDYKYYEKENGYYKCKNSCSDGKFYLLNGSECWDDKNECLPDYNHIGNDYICLKECSSKYGEYYEKDGNFTKCLKTCDKYIVNDTKECISSCPPNYYTSPNKMCYKQNCTLDNDYPFTTKDKNGTNVCAKKCNDIEPYYGKDKICRENCSDFEETPIIDNYDNKCVSSCEPPYFPYLENNACVYKCSKYVNNKNECVDKCVGDYNYIEGQECRKSCEEPNFAKKIDENMFKCVTRCDKDEYYYEIANIFTIRKCFSRCLPNDFIIQDTQICCTECPSDYYSYYYTNNLNSTYVNNTCVKKCPEDKPFIYSRQCLSECPSNQKYHLYGEYNCRVDCPEGSKIEDNMCTSECSENRFLDVNNQCVEECKKPNEYNFEGSKKCTDKCDNGYYYEGKQCVKYCSENYTFINGSNCVDKCESGIYHVSYTDTGIKNICNEECQKYKYFDSETNLTICKDECNYILNETICLDICKDDYHFYDYENGTCLNKCPDNYYYIDDSDNLNNNTKCYKKCPSQYPYYNKTNFTCSDECTYGYLNYTSKECMDMDKCITNNGKIYEDEDNEDKKVRYCLNNCTDFGLFEFGNKCVKECPLNESLVLNMEEKKCECKNLFYKGENNQTICINKCEGDYKYRLFKKKECLSNCNNYIISLDEDYCYEEENQCPQNSEVKSNTNDNITEKRCECKYKYYKDKDNNNSTVCLGKDEECPNNYKYMREDSSECIINCETGYLELGNVCLNQTNNYKYWYFKDNKYKGINNCSEVNYILIHNSTQCIEKCKGSFPVYPNVNDINECLPNCDDIPNTISNRVNNSNKSDYECKCIDLWYQENNIIHCNHDTNKKTCDAAFEGKNKTYLIKETKECVENCNNFNSFGKECFKKCDDIKSYYGFVAEEKNKECKCKNLWKKEAGTEKIICINSEICYENGYDKLIYDTKECTNSCGNKSEFNHSCYSSCNDGQNLISENENACKCAYKWYKYDDKVLNVSDIYVCLGEKEECPKDFYPYLDDFNQQCVEDISKCSNSSIIFNNTCYSQCPNKTVEKDNTCVCDKSDENEGKWYQYTYEGKVLIQCGLSECPENRVLDNESQECIYSCEENKYYYDGGCYTKCPTNTKLIDELTKECVDINPFEGLKDLKSLEENIKANIKTLYRNNTSNNIVYNINNSTMQIYGVNKNKEDKKDVIMRNNLTYIDLSYCLDKLYQKNQLSEDTDIVIVKYDIGENKNSSTINPVEFKAINSKTGQEIPLDACDDNSIIISYPLMNILNSFINEPKNLRSIEEEEDGRNLNLREKFLKGKELYIDNEEIDTFDLSNKLYTDICYPFKMNGKDLILEDRLNYLYPFCSFCESNCKHNRTDFIAERVYCSCNPKDQINFERTLELMKSDPDMDKTKKDQKASILKCLSKISQISKNLGFFYGLIIILAEVAMCIFTLLYSYKVFVMRLNSKFDIKEDYNNDNINTENLETVNLSGRDKYYDKNKNGQIIKTSERNLQHPPKNKKQIKVIEINEDKKEKRKDTKKKTANKKEDNANKANIINIKNTEKENIQKYKEEDRISSNGYNIYAEKSTLGTFKDSEDENIFDLIKLESTLLTIDYQKALQKNKAEILIMILTEILDKIYIVKAIWFLQKYAIVSLYVSLYLLWHLLIISFLSLFYNYSNLHKIWIKENYPNLNFHLSFGFLSCIISFIFYKGLCFLIFNDRKIAEIESLQRENNNEMKEKYKKMIFWAKIKIIIFYALVFILSIIFFLYLMAFCGIYIGTKAKLFESYGIALIEVVIIKILYGIALGILRKVSLTYEIEKLYFIVRILDLYIS